MLPVVDGLGWLKLDLVGESYSIHLNGLYSLQNLFTLCQLILTAVLGESDREVRQVTSSRPVKRRSQE